MKADWNDLAFDLKAMKAQVAHARASVDHRTYFGEATGPALWWVKDDGTYLMSNGSVVTRPEVVYAEGLSNKDDCYDTLIDICGGDDFAEVFGDDVMSLIENAPFVDGWVVLTVDEGEVSIRVEPK